MTDVPLRRLTLEETGRQLADCSADLVAAVYRRSAGNPYLSAELAGGGAEPSESLRQVLVSRLEAVDPRARMVVAAAATLGRALTDDELLAAASGDADAVWTAYEAGLVVREPEHGSAARHPVLAEVAYERLLSPERRRLHARMAAQLKAALPEHPTAAEVAELAEQYRCAEDADRGLVWSVRAAVAAERGYAIAEAGHWYAVAASMRDSSRTPPADIPERLSLLVLAATHLAAVGHPAQAVALLKGDLTALSDDTGVVVRAALTRCWLGTAVADTELALNDAALAERLTPPEDELTWGRIYAGRATALGTCSRWEEAAGPARTALELATKCGDLRTVGTAHGLLGVEATLQNRFADALGHKQTALAIAWQLAEPEDLALVGVVLTHLYWRLGDADRVVQVATFVRPRVRRLMLGLHWLEDILDGNVVQTLYDAGRWDEAIAWVSDPSATSELGLFQSALARVRLARGDVAAAEELQAQGESVGDRDQPQFLTLYVEVRARLLLHAGRPSEGLDEVLAAAEKIHGTLSEIDEASLLFAGLETAVAATAPERFERLVTLLGKTTEGPIGAAVSAVVAGERSRLAGVPDPEPWLVAAREWAAAGRPYDEARARFRAAEAILATRSGADARHRAGTELAAAQRLAEDLRATPLLDEIHKLARLARIDPVRPSERRRSAAERPEPGLALTDREQQVLALLADGRTNREIGDALYMSPKTASVHVTHILEKLGVQSRVQAAAMAARLGLDKHA